MVVTLYTIANSPFCQQAQEYLTAHNIAYTQKDVEVNKDDLNEMLRISDHFTGVPFVHVVMDDGSEAGLRGFTQEEYDQVFSQQQSGQQAPVPPSAQDMQQAQVAQQQTPSEQPAMSQVEPQPVATPVTPAENTQATPMNQAAEPVEPMANQLSDVNQYKAEEVAHMPEPMPNTQAQPSQQLGDVMKNLMQQSDQSTPVQNTIDEAEDDLDAASTQGGSVQNQSMPQPVTESTGHSTMMNQQPTVGDQNFNSDVPQPIEDSSEQQNNTSNPTIPDFPH